MAHTYTRVDGKRVKSAPEARKALPLVVRDRCHHQGELLEEVPCTSCQGNVRIKVFACDRHGRCSLAKSLPGTKTCSLCADHEAVAPPAAPATVPNAAQVRHLLYHVYPVNGERWRWNLDQVKKHIGLFNGRRLMAIATDASSAPAGEVKAYLHGLGFEFLEVANDPGKMDGAALIPLLERISDLTGPEHVFFRAHAKGVTRTGSAIARRWAEVMYDLCLGRFDLVEEALKHKPVAGVFKKIGNGWAIFNSKSQWHYSGSFYWMRNRDLFARDWRKTEPHYCVGEAYPSLHFKSEESACLFLETPIQQVNLYDPTAWKNLIEPELAKLNRKVDKPSGPDVGRVRHLLYHIYPRRGSNWRWNALKLLERLGLFNGKKVIAIATDRTTDDPHLVEWALAGQGCEFLRIPNNPDLREVETFLPLFERVKTDRHDEAVLYAHAKGTSRRGTEFDQVAHRWTEVLYETYLDYWPLVKEQLGRFPVTGSFKKVGVTWPVESPRSLWHYSGSWFWFRAADLFAKPDWQGIERWWSGIEPYPSLHFPEWQAGCLFFERPMQGFQLYEPPYWAREVEPAYALWKQQMQAYRQEVPYVPC